MSKHNRERRLARSRKLSPNKHENRRIEKQVVEYLHRTGDGQIWVQRRRRYRKSRQTAKVE